VSSHTLQPIHAIRQLVPEREHQRVPKRSTSTGVTQVDGKSLFSRRCDGQRGLETAVVLFRATAVRFPLTVVAHGG
jgi:hypothetical protein